MSGHSDFVVPGIDLEGQTAGRYPIFTGNGRAIGVRSMQPDKAYILSWQIEQTWPDVSRSKFPNSTSSQVKFGRHELDA
jgi:hypothetical protein